MPCQQAEEPRTRGVHGASGTATQPPATLPSIDYWDAATRGIPEPPAPRSWSPICRKG